jgi:phosphoglycerol transferase MdoB-like AlkP superfamily enzyme
MKKITIFLLNLGVFLCSFFAYHIAFFFMYGSTTGLGLKDIVPALLTGLRFDLSTTAYLMVPFSVLIFIPYFSRKDAYKKILVLCNLCWLILVAIYLFVDLQYYSFAARHLSFELFNTTGDLLSIVKIGWLEYAPQLAIFFLFLAGISFAYLSLSKRVLNKCTGDGYPFMKRIIIESSELIVVLVLLIIMTRGGIQTKPITLSDSAKFNSPFMQHLALNGVYTTLRTFYSMRENKEMMGWKKRYCSQKEALQNGQAMIISPDKEDVPDHEYPLSRHYRHKKDEFKPLNVVIFVMESWSSKYIGALGGVQDATPFFDRLSKKGVFFEHFFANGQRSIEGISAIAASIPPSGGMIMSRSGVLSQMPAKPLPALLKEKSYKTFFIHGAQRGSMGFDGLVKQMGVDICMSREDMAKEGGRDDGVWGIYDEDAFLFADRVFEKQKGPFFAVVFSLSSHLPYKLPSERFRYYKPDLPNHEFLNVLRYSDYALERYFDEAAKKDYFSNTIFVIVGDHSEGKSTRKNLYEKFSVPCMIYAPSHLKPMVITKTVTQVDLMPTILDVLKFSDDYASFGQSAFSKKPGFGLLTYGDADVFVKDGWLLSASMNNVEETFNYLLSSGKNMSPEQEEKVTELRKEKGYYLQLFHDLIMTNKFYKK